MTTSRSDSSLDRKNILVLSSKLQLQKYRQRGVGVPNQQMDVNSTAAFYDTGLCLGSANPWPLSLEDLGLIRAQGSCFWRFANSKKLNRDGNCM